MKFGFFDDPNKEYVITTPKTPLPWINYLGSTDFFSLISNTCGGYSFYKDAKLLPVIVTTISQMMRGDVITTSRTAIPYGIRAGCRSKQSLTLMSAAMVWGTAVSLL